MIRVAHRGVGGRGTIGRVPAFTNTDEIGDTNITATPGLLTIGDQGVAGEGGQITLVGQGAFASWGWDTLSDVLRWFTSAVVKMSLTTAGNLAVAGLMQATEFWVGVDLALSASGARLRMAADATWSAIEFWAAGSARWEITSAALRPLADNTYDVGAAAPNRLRDVWVAGEVIAPNETKYKSPAQAAFTNVATAVTGMDFLVGIGETWVLDYVIPLTMVGALGVKFWISTPAGAGEIVRGGNIGSAVTWQTHWLLALGIPGAPFYCTFAGAGVYIMRVTFTSGVVAGTVQLMGQTGGVGTTCAVDRGCSMIARRNT